MPVVNIEQVSTCAKVFMVYGRLGMQGHCGRLLSGWREGQGGLPTNDADLSGAQMCTSNYQKAPKLRIPVMWQ